MGRKKVHNLKTIEDISEVITEENFERMMMDITNCLYYHLRLKEKAPELRLKSIAWKDDNIVGMSSLTLLDNKTGKELEKVKFDLKKINYKL